MTEKTQATTTSFLKWTISAVVISMLMGCTVGLISGGKDVELITKVSPDENGVLPCKELGAVEVKAGLGQYLNLLKDKIKEIVVTLVSSKEDTINKVRNTVAEMGGNAYALTEVTVDGGLTSVKAKAYDCQKKPESGSGSGN